MFTEQNERASVTEMMGTFSYEKMDEGTNESQGDNRLVAKMFL